MESRTTSSPSVFHPKKSRYQRKHSTSLGDPSFVTPNESPQPLTLPQPFDLTFHSQKPGEPSNGYNGGDPFSSSAENASTSQPKHVSKRARFLTSKHKSVIVPPDPVANRTSGSDHDVTQLNCRKFGKTTSPHLRGRNRRRMTYDQEIEGSRAQRRFSTCLPGSRQVEPDTAEFEPQTSKERPLRSTMSSPHLIANPNNELFSSSRRSYGVDNRFLQGSPQNPIAPIRSASNQASLDASPSKGRIPGIPAKGTIERWEEELANASKANSPSPERTPQTNPEVVDVDAESASDGCSAEPEAVAKTKRPTPGVDAVAVRKPPRGIHLRSRPPPDPPKSEERKTSLLKVPKLKSQTQATSVSKVGKGVSTIPDLSLSPSREEEVESVIVEDNAKVKVAPKPSCNEIDECFVFASFKEEIQFDEQYAKETMEYCAGGHRAVINLSYMGMNDMQLTTLMSAYSLSENNASKTLILRKNNISKFSSTNGQITGLWNVRSLDLSCNSLMLVDDMNRRLRVLNLSRNCLSSLPDTISNLSELELLDVSRNMLCGLPPKFCQLKKLENLDLRSNDLEKLPEDCFGEGCNLKTFLISKNKHLNELPKCASYLTKIEVFQLKETGIYNNLRRGDHKLGDVGLICLLAGKDAKQMAERKSTGLRFRFLRSLESDEVEAVT